MTTSNEGTVTGERLTELPVGELLPGDYWHRGAKGAPLKITVAPKRLGMVYRVVGLTRQVGHHVEYLDARETVTATRGFPSCTLPEDDLGAPQ